VNSGLHSAAQSQLAGDAACGAAGEDPGRSNPRAAANDIRVTIYGGLKQANL
jgi:hypothetical protein